jgi:hypothetical protein
MSEIERYASIPHTSLLSTKPTLSRGKAREKMLERELAKLAGENWQVCMHFDLD